MIKSDTAIQHGSGSFRWVSGLSKKEREAVKNGEMVYFESFKTYHTQSGYKIVSYRCGRYGSKEPNDAELKEIQAAERLRK